MNSYATQSAVLSSNEPFFICAYCNQRKVGLQGR